MRFHKTRLQIMPNKQKEVANRVPLSSRRRVINLILTFVLTLLAAISPYVTHSDLLAQTVPTPTPFPSPTVPVPPTWTPTPTRVPPTVVPSELPTVATKSTEGTSPMATSTHPAHSPSPSLTPAVPANAEPPTATAVLSPAIQVMPSRPFWMIVPGKTIQITATVRNAGPATTGIPITLVLPADVTLSGWQSVPSILPTPEAQTWIVPQWPVSQAITLSLEVTAGVRVPLGSVYDVWLTWPGKEASGAVLATLAFPPDHLPAVGEKSPLWEDTNKYP